MSRLRSRSALMAAARVAAVTTLVAAVLYSAAAAAILGIAHRQLTDAVDSQLTDVLGFFQRNPERLVGASPFQREPDPSTFSTTYGWFIDLNGQPISETPQAPRLPAYLYHVGGPTSVTLSGTSLRLLGGPISGDRVVPVGWLVLGESTHFIDVAVLSLLLAEAVLAVPLLAVIFLIALLIGRLSAAPIERARQQLLTFTADASHELRTPLQVIEAEVSLALQRERTAAAYRGTIQRVQAESGRLRRLVDDLLWLARFEHQPQAPPNDLIDLRAVAAEAVERFEAVARRRGQVLELAPSEGQAALISAPTAWVERLAGVVVDNACRYSPDDGLIRIAVEVAGNRARLAVEDSGPGIPPSQRRAIFERFHRATDTGGGAGLGLAIGNAVVQATGGRWEISEAPEGGARVAVSWDQARKPRGERRGEAAPTAA